METPGRVLIVDGDPATRRGVEAALKGVADVACCSSVAEARTALDQHRVDVVWCEWQLPDGNALAVLHRAQERSPQALFIAVTARDDVARLKQEPALASYRVLPRGTSDDVIAMTVRQGIAVSRMRDSARFRRPTRQ